MTDYDSDDIKKQISTLIKNHLNTDNENKEIEQRIKVEEDEDEERNSRENELKDMCENEILNLQNLQCLNSSEDEINPLNHNNNNTTTNNNNNNSGSNQFIKKNYNNGETPLLQHYKRIKNKTGNSKNDIIKTKTPPLLLSLSSTRLTSVKDNNSPTLMTQIKRQFLQFCETTSLRGVPRIVSTKDSKRRFLWLIFVISFFIGCIICLTFIINQYLEFDVIHQPKKIYDQPRPFPSVTLCNLRPFSTRDIRKLKKAGVLPVDMYFELLKRFMISVPIEYRRHLTMLWDFSTYLANLPELVDANHLGHTLEDIVKRCFILYKTGSVTRGTACEKSGYWTKTQDRVFHNCYTYTVNPNRTNTALNMELVVYLDNLIEQTDCFDCQERVMASQLTGARLLLHPGASYPRVAEEGVNLMPGTMTDIRFTVYEWSMMEPPHGRCSKNTPKFISFNNVSYTFSEEACHAYMVQEKVASNCQCLTQHLPIPTHLLGKDLRKCQAFKLPATYQMLDNFTKSKQLYFNQEVVAHFAHFAECAEKTGTAMDSYQVGCRPACVRYTYKPSITAAQWPTKTFLTWFVTKFIKEMESYGRSHLNSTNNESLKVFNERMEELRKPLQPYEKIANLTKEGDLQEAIKMLMQTQIFEQNFLSIIISRPNFDLERVEEKAVVSLTSLFSQIGGLLSIWIGLTFVCIVEIVELGLNVADAVIHYKKSKS
ncbi:unnamed protein product [Heterobilharzia americana]|nr:unnamed protein product [Heterobilharzia americana]